MRRASLLLVALLAACGTARAPSTQSETDRMLLLRAGTAPPEPGRETWGSSSEPEHATAPVAGTEDVAGDTFEGRASFYSDRLAGHRTASGEPYDPSALTAASRDLPLGTRVRVTRTDTGASVVVRVNDRGPFGDHSRILDLSRAAAERLDMMRAGVVSIRADVLP